MNLQKVALLSALTLAVLAQSQLFAAPDDPVASVPTPPPVDPVAQVQDGSLAVARNASDVLVSWILPAGEFRQIEIFRNTSRVITGRGRAGTVRVGTPYFIDKVPDLSVTYYYWLKLTRPDNTTINLGPVGTPSPTVWQP